MKLLYGYLKPYKGLIALTMLLATTNTVFSLIDPIIFGKIIKLSQDINTRQENGSPLGWDEFFAATVVLLLMSMGTAMVSRIAKNFQDYFLNVVIQKFGAKVLVTFPIGILSQLLQNSLLYKIFKTLRLSASSFRKY